MAFEKLNLAAEKNLTLDCVRLRPMNSTTHSIGEVYGAERVNSTLDSLGFYGQKPLYLETRLPSQEFPAEDTSILLTMVAWPRGATEPTAPFPLKIDREATLLEVKSRVVAQLHDGATAEAVRVLRLHNADLEVVEASDMKKLKSELGIVDGAVLHVEVLNEDGSSPFLKKFDEEQNRVEIRFNPIDSREYSQSVHIDRRKPLSALKDLISTKIQVPVNEFKLKKSILSKEFRQPELSLDRLDLSDGTSVFVQRGTPLRLDEQLVAVHTYDFTTEQLTPLCEIVLNEQEVTILQLKQMIAARMKIDEADALRIRVREKYQSRPGRTLSLVEKSLRDNLAMLQMYRGGIVIGSASASGSQNEAGGGQEKVALVAQLLPKVDEVRPRDMILEVQQYHPAKNDFAAREELVLPENSTVGDLRTLLGTTRSGLAPEFVAVAKPLRFRAKDVEDLNWEMADETSLTSTPMYLKDGDLVLYKDLREHEPGTEIIDENGSRGIAVKPKVGHLRVEKALRIHVMTKQEEDEKRQHEQEEKLKEKQRADAVAEAKAAATSSTVPPPPPPVPKS